MRISDWSSDVCSSDLDIAVHQVRHVLLVGEAHQLAGLAGMVEADRVADLVGKHVAQVVGRRIPVEADLPDRKSVVWGKSVSVRVDLGGRRIIKKKNTNDYDVRLV